MKRFVCLSHPEESEIETEWWVKQRHQGHVVLERSGGYYHVYCFGQEGTPEMQEHVKKHQPVADSKNRKMERMEKQKEMKDQKVWKGKGKADDYDDDDDKVMMDKEQKQQQQQQQQQPYCEGSDSYNASTSFQTTAESTSIHLVPEIISEELIRKECQEPVHITYPGEEIACSIPGTSLWKLCKLKLNRNMPNEEVDDTCDTWGASPMSAVVADAIYHYRLVRTIDYEKNKSCNSIVSWIHIVLNVPFIERYILVPPVIEYEDGTTEEDHRTVIRELSETEEFRKNWNERYLYHIAQGREKEKFLYLGLLDYQDKHKLFKGSKEAYFVSIGNMIRSLRTMSFMQLLIAEMSGDPDDINKVRRAQLRELVMLHNGILMYIPGMGGMVWVYGGMVGQIADLMAQFKNTSVASPGGRYSQQPCSTCLATRDDFSKSMEPGQVRDMEQSCRAIEQALKSKTKKEATEILRRVGLTIWALKNANFQLPGVRSVFEIQARDILHIIFWDVKETMKKLFKMTRLMTKRDRHEYDRRCKAVRSMNLSWKYYPPYSSGVVHWNAKNCENTLLLLPWTLEGLVDDDILHYFKLTAMIHFMLIAPEVEVVIWPVMIRFLYNLQRMCLQAWLPDELGKSMVCDDGSVDGDDDDDDDRSCCESEEEEEEEEDDDDDDDDDDEKSKEEQMRLMRNTLGNHHVCHIPGEILRWGPSCNVSSSVFEHAQGNVRDIAKRRSKNPEEFGFQYYTAWQVRCMAEIQRKDTSRNSHYLQAIDACTELQKKKSGGGIKYWGVDIMVGSIVMQINTLGEEQQQQMLSGSRLSEIMVTDLFTFYEVLGINVENKTVYAQQLLVPESNPLKCLLQPFELVHDKNFEPYWLPLSTCNRVIACLDTTSQEPGSKISRLIIPTRYI